MQCSRAPVTAPAGTWVQRRAERRSDAVVVPVLCMNLVGPMLYVYRRRRELRNAEAASETTTMTRNTRKTSLAKPEAAPTTPVNPSRPEVRAAIRNNTVQLGILLKLQKFQTYTSSHSPFVPIHNGVEAGGIA